MSELLTKQFNTALALRKLNYFEIEQNNTTFTMRPQLHVLVVKPFGTIKSSYTAEFEDKIDADVIRLDEITKPALLGTIAQDKTYNPGILTKAGGKIIVVDEFNNLNEDALKALLAPLENQKIDRVLGHATTTTQIHDPDEWTNIQVQGGHISGKIQFTCIAFSMFYPKPKNNSVFEENPQSLLGLKSRFSPNFSEPGHSELMDELRGNKPFELEDVGTSAIRHILIKKSTYTEYIDMYENLTLPFVDGDRPLLDNKQRGFLTRVHSDILRFAAHDEIKKAVAKGNTERMLKITDPEFLIKNAEKWTLPLLNQYIHEERSASYEAFCDLLNKKPDQTHAYYAQQLNVSTKTIQRWNNKRESEVLKVDRKFH